MKIENYEIIQLIIFGLCCIMLAFKNNFIAAGIFFVGIQLNAIRHQLTYYKK